MKERNNLHFIDKVILFYLIFEIFFLRWLVYESYFKYFSPLLVLIIIVRKKHIFRVKPLDLFLGMFYLMVVILNLLNNGIKPRFISNFYILGLANLIIIIYILILNYENENGLRNFVLKEIFIIFNSYFIINIPIIIKQLNRTYFLMRNIENNPMYEDHITGLIGASGTHELTFYWSLLILINIYKYFKSRKKSILLMSFIEVIFMINISAQNDNTAFFIIFFVIILQYLFITTFRNKVKIINIIKLLLVLTCILSIAQYFYNNNPIVYDFINRRVVVKMEQYGILESSNSSAARDEERIALFKVALEQGDGYGFGKGIGSIISYGDPSLPKHFGMSEISFRTYEGGLIYLLSIILILTHFLNRIFIKKGRLSCIMSFILIGVNITFMCIYTNIYRKPFFALSLGLIIFIYKQQNNDEKYIR